MGSMGRYVINYNLLALKFKVLEKLICCSTLTFWTLDIYGQSCIILFKVRIKILDIRKKIFVNIIPIELIILEISYKIFD